MALWVAAHAIWAGNVVAPTTNVSSVTTVAPDAVAGSVPALNRPVLAERGEHPPHKSLIRIIPLADLAIS